MTFRLEKDKTTSTPYILLDEDKSYMKLEGRCFHENVGEFFEEINNWLSAYLVTDFKIFTFDNAMNYFNSSTTKLLYNMLKKLDSYASADKNIVVNWITSPGNDIMVECGEDFQEEMENLEFNIVINE